VNKRVGWFLLIVLTLALSPAAMADNKVGQHPEVPARTQKAAKDYNKQLRKSEKMQSKAVKKQMKQLDKKHPEMKGKSHS